MLLWIYHKFMIGSCPAKPEKIPMQTKRLLSRFPANRLPEFCADRLSVQCTGIVYLAGGKEVLDG